MVVVNKIKVPKEFKDGAPEDKDWDNPTDPEHAEDERDAEQLIRQKREAERRKNNLSEDPENTKED
ncbi:hypothetical protein [Pedobacter sp. SYSU D00535]|uniref:hypothetical protein n=1 Tax=Pedobacter sp. SYSU D00535 TaxID=2810308 RepID=UPI001A96F4FC|nr:hypothetical protein [Pedobacter sp. SYSU D00535]